MDERKTESTVTDSGNRQGERPGFGIEFDNTLKMYTISGSREDLLGLGMKIVAELDDSDSGERTEVMRKDLESGQVLRPGFGTFSIKLTEGGLLVRNINSPSDDEQNRILQSAVNQAIGKP